MNTQEMLLQKPEELIALIIDFIQDKKIIFFDEGTKTQYDVESVILINNKICMTGGRNHEGLKEPREYPYGRDISRGSPNKSVLQM